MKINLFILILSLSASAAEFSGRLYYDSYFATREIVRDRKFLQNSLSAWGQVDHKLSELLGVRAIFQGDGFDGGFSQYAGDSKNTNARGQFREAYFNFRKEGFELRGGIMILPWGKADGINPTDFLTAKDQRYFNPDDETKRIGATGVQLNLTPDSGLSPWTFTGVFLPVFAKTKLLIPSQSIPGTATLFEPDTPPVTLENSEVAGKIAYVGEGWDISLSGFNGWLHSPQFEVSRAVSVGSGVISVDVKEKFTKMSAVGSDFSIVKGKYTYRGEFAYKQTQNSDASDPTLLPSFLEGIVGVERPFGDHFRLQTQVYQRHFPKYKFPASAQGVSQIDTVAKQAVAKSNSQINQYQDQNFGFAITRLSYTLEEEHFDADVFVVVNLAGGDCLIRPKASYGWTDNFKTTLGADYYSGPTDKPLGASNSLNSVFAELKYTF